MPMLICTLGDLVLDVIVRLEEPLVAGDDVLATTRRPATLIRHAAGVMPGWALRGGRDA